jgi:hypothetical protein
MLSVSCPTRQVFQQAVILGVNFDVRVDVEYGVGLHLHHCAASPNHLSNLA